MDSNHADQETQRQEDGGTWQQTYVLGDPHPTEMMRNVVPHLPVPSHVDVREERVLTLRVRQVGLQRWRRLCMRKIKVIRGGGGGG